MASEWRTLVPEWRRTMTYRAIREKILVEYNEGPSVACLRYICEPAYRARIKFNAKKTRNEKRAAAITARYRLWRELCPHFNRDKHKRDHLRRAIRRTGGGLAEYAVAGVLSVNDLIHLTPDQIEEIRQCRTRLLTTPLSSGSTERASAFASRLSQARNAATSSPLPPTSTDSRTS